MTMPKVGDRVTGTVFLALLPPSTTPFIIAGDPAHYSGGGMAVLSRAVEVSVEVTVDPRLTAVEALEAERRAAAAEWKAKDTQLLGRIQSLLAIENGA